MDEKLGAKKLTLADTPAHDSQVSDHFSHWGSPSEVFDTDTVNISYVVLEPGEEGPMHAHGSPVEEFYVILEGKLDIDIMDPETEETKTFELTPGELAYFPSGVYKKPVNRSDERAIELRFGSVGDTDGPNVIEGA